MRAYDLRREAPEERGQDHVELEYGQEKWPAVEERIEMECQAEEPARLSRVMSRIARWEWYSPDSLEPQDAVMGGQLVTVPQNIAYGGAQNVVLQSVLDACAEDTEIVVELGSGWGRNLFLAWLNGGPRTATYVGAEYTGSGRRAASRLAELEPELAFRSFPFDYNQPQLSELGHFRKALVFTCHSIEQIPRLTPAVFHAVRELADSVTCIHLEPVGWQLGDKRSDGPSQEHAERHDYNRDLVRVVQEEAAQGRLVIERTDPDVVGSNAVNPTTVISWRSPPPA